ncbi:S8 family peptidase [Bacillus cereus]|uniref:S8 family peptidase n=1 Tax=Bacillus cereus TaxID=1396 RepID=UPI000B7D4E44|nr:S8 family serine peptidase [Bacillus cereus]
MKKLCLSIILVFLFITYFPYKVVNATEHQYYTFLLKDEKNFSDIKRLIDNTNGRIIYEVRELGLFQIEASSKTVAQIAQSPLVETYNPSLRLKELETEKNVTVSKKTEERSAWDLQWDMKQITNNGESYKLFSGTKNVTVGIIDSGIDVNHRDLQNNIVTGSKNLVPMGGFQGAEPYETGDPDYLNDNLGHGTHVAGQIAANGIVKGVAPGIGIKSYRIFGKKSSELIWVIKAIVEAAKDNNDVINLSFGEYLVKGAKVIDGKKQTGDLAEIQAYQKAINFAHKKGSAIVAAAGNDALNVKDKIQMTSFLQQKMKKDNVNYIGEILDVPAALSKVITVASVGPSDELSLFSNYGLGFIDIAAPGGDFRLLKENNLDDYNKYGLFKKEQILSTWPDNDYFFTSGNSIASAKVSGALALIIDKYHLKKQPNKSTRFLYKYGVNKRDDTSLYGNGTLNIYKMLSK